mgnify:CR=1 FL=1
MSGKKRKSRLTGTLMALLGAACALILCAVFYGTMVYQLADRTDGAQAKQAEPAKTLALGSGEMEGESRERVQMGGKLCDVLTRTYLLADGTRAQAITASPAAYIERMKQEGWQRSSSRASPSAKRTRYTRAAGKTRCSARRTAKRFT